MTYGVSNSHVSDDVNWPRKIKLVTPIRFRVQHLKNSWRCYFSNNWYTT